MRWVRPTHPGIRNQVRPTHPGIRNQVRPMHPGIRNQVRPTHPGIRNRSYDRDETIASMSMGPTTVTNDPSSPCIAAKFLFVGRIE